MRRSPPSPPTNEADICKESFFKFFCAFWHTIEAVELKLNWHAYVAKAAIDTFTHQAGNNVFEKWGPWFDARTSWKNKYATGSWEAGAPRPRFWLSTRVLVGWSS